MTTIERQKAVYKLDRFVVSCQFWSYLAKTTRVTQSISSDVIVGDVHLFYLQMCFILFIRWFISLFVSVSICSLFYLNFKSIFVTLCFEFLRMWYHLFWVRTKDSFYCNNYICLIYTILSNNRLCIVCVSSYWNFIQES